MKVEDSTSNEKGREDINVRNKAKSLLYSVLTFKDLIGAGLKFDASG